MLAHVVLGTGIWLLAGLPVLTAQHDAPTTEATQALSASPPPPEIRPNPAAPDAGAGKGEDDPGPMSPVPEPGTLAIVGAGFVLAAFLLKRRKRAFRVESNA